jgi:hypothetical protein
MSKLINKIKKMFTSYSNIENEELNDYKKVNIQNLERKQQIIPENINKKITVRKLTKKFYTPDDKLYYYLDTGLEQRIYLQNNFIGAFMIAYNGHGDILLNPDDIWLAISFYFSTYVDNNAEKLRYKFVNHDGKKKLVVKDTLDEKEWQPFFSVIIQQIRENTKEGIVDELSCDFSTTTEIKAIISTAIIMNSFKKYFEYCRMIMQCGINNVYFEGIREDWIKLINKANNLKKYDVDGKLINYLKHIEIILKEFLNTFDGKPNVKFWNKIMTINRETLGSGNEQYISGWITHFYGIYNEVSLDKIPDYSICVPVELQNQKTGKTKELEINSNWCSVSKVSEYFYKPDIGLCIVEKYDDNLYNPLYV